MKKTKYLIPIVVMLGLIFVIKNPKHLIPIVVKLGVIQDSLESWRNPLKEYGVFYSWSHGEHYEVTILDFWLRTDKGKINGPSFIGDDLSLDFVRMRDDPVPEIVVRSGPDYCVAKLIMRDGKAVGFHIVEDHSIGIGFPTEGYYDN